jgi:hypothetical protein
MGSLSVLRRRVACACAIAAALLLGIPAAARAAITHVGAVSATTDSTTLSLAKPAGTAQNDVLVATVFVAGSNAVTAAGWTPVAGADAVATSGDGRLVSFYKVAGASEPASYGFGTAGSGGATRKATAGISVYRGADPAAPVEGGAATSGAAGGSPYAPAPVTAHPNSVAIAVVGFRASGSGLGTHITFSSGASRWAEQSTDVPAELVDQSVAAAGTAPQVTATSNRAFTGWAANSLALREEPALTATFPGAYAWGTWAIGDNTSSPQSVSVTSNRAWGLKLSSDQVDGRMTEWNGTAYLSRRIGSPLRWRLSALAGAAQGTTFAPLSDTAATAVSAQAAAPSPVAATITYRQSVSYADEAGLGGNSYRSVVTFQAGQGF